MLGLNLFASIIGRPLQDTPDAKDLAPQDLTVESLVSLQQHGSHHGEHLRCVSFQQQLPPAAAAAAAAAAEPFALEPPSRHTLLSSSFSTTASVESLEEDLRHDLIVSSSIGPCSTIGTCSTAGGCGGSSNNTTANSSRRQSILSDSGRASRGCSVMFDTHPSTAPSTGPSSPAGPHQQVAGLSGLQAEDGPWWATTWSYGSHYEQNVRSHMEDRITAQDISGHTAFAHAAAPISRAGFFAVFDGHSGHEAAEYLSEHLLNYVLNDPELLVGPQAALQRAVERAEEEIVAKFAERACNAGSTLLALLLVDDKLYIANVGDCRAVIARGGEPTQLTRDHKPQCAQELERIAAADPEAVITADGYMYGELAVARGIGSQHLKLDPSKRAFTYEPEMHTVALAREDDFVVLATDGLWDKVSNKEAVVVARKSLAASKDAGACARALVDRAQRQQSQDNISVVVLCLHSRAISLPKTNSRLFLGGSRRQLTGTGGTDSPRPGTPCSSVGAPSLTATPRCNTPVD